MENNKVMTIILNMTSYSYCGEKYSDHPLCGVALLKRFLEKNGFVVGVIDVPQDEEDILKLGKPRLFFGISSGSIDSMLRNYNALKKSREEDKNVKYKRSSR